jgi:hypothetical protein
MKKTTYQITRSNGIIAGVAVASLMLFGAVGSASAADDVAQKAVKVKVLKHDVELAERELQTRKANKGAYKAALKQNHQGN